MIRSSVISLLPCSVTFYDSIPTFSLIFLKLVPGIFFVCVCVGGGGGGGLLCTLVWLCVAICLCGVISEWSRCGTANVWVSLRAIVSIINSECILL